jgi:hypothetical protein
MRRFPLDNGSLLVNFDDKYRIRDARCPDAGRKIIR